MRSLAYVLLIAVSAAVAMCSDLFIRSQHIPGTDPHSWDVVGTCGISLGAALLVTEHFFNDNTRSRD